MNTSYAVIENGMVVNVIVWDGEAEFTVPDNQQLINISDISEQPGIGWVYSDEGFTAPPTPERSHDELVADAEQKKQSLIDTAMASISLIQLKLQAGRNLTQAETTRLNAVLDYINAVTATDTSTAPDVNWPAFPEA
ncbi:TPA: tail fiber assembly protein [Escherichia coli]|nr:tail fiber assembly protein [Shigella sonnei]TNK48924.1 tail fiber assembly protein [Escherichia coli]OYM01188.1 phage tail protein [Shigella sonnei]HBK9583535.1 tail fiber assembly protein [Escherichia coli]HDV4908921.1 tail fiber assembly protein [Escherichia coli]HDW2510669.1 tail fiber assembly protein [Escherichia coli]